MLLLFWTLFNCELLLIDNIPLSSDVRFCKVSELILDLSRSERDMDWGWGNEFRLFDMLLDELLLVCICIWGILPVDIIVGALVCDAFVILIVELLLTLLFVLTYFSTLLILLLVLNVSP